MCVYACVLWLEGKIRHYVLLTIAASSRGEWLALVRDYADLHATPRLPLCFERGGGEEVRVQPTNALHGVAGCVCV